MIFIIILLLHEDVHVCIFVNSCFTCLEEFTLDKFSIRVILIIEYLKWNGQSCKNGILSSGD